MSTPAITDRSSAIREAVELNRRAQQERGLAVPGLGALYAVWTMTEAVVDSFADEPRLTADGRTHDLVTGMSTLLSYLHPTAFVLNTVSMISASAAHDAQATDLWGY